MKNEVSEDMGAVARTLATKPVLSGLSAAFGAASTYGFFNHAGGGLFMLGTFLASPIVSIGLGISAVLDLFKQRGGLSKTFSAAAAGSAGLGLAAMASVQGPDALAAPLFTMMGMTAAGALNVAAYYTRNVHFAVSVEKQAPSETTPPPAP